MKTILLAASAMLCLGVGVAYADGGDDEGGAVANTYLHRASRRGRRSARGDRPTM